MRILVLNPPFLPKYSRPQRSPAVTKSGTLYFPLWLAYAVGGLEKAGHDVLFLDAPARGLSLEDTLARAQAHQPRLIVMDTSTPSIRHDLEVAGALKQRLPGAFLVLVGTHVSALPEEALRLGPAADAVARREYDETLRAVAERLDRAGQAKPEADVWRTVEGISFRSGDEIVHNPDRPFIENLDELPWVSRVYRRHLQIGDYFNQNSPWPMVTLITSRGCPFRCTFCVYPQVLTGRGYRFRRIADVVDEVEYVTREFPEAKSIFFEDDTLTANKKRCTELAEALVARGIRLPWTANSRVELDLETMRTLKQSGCRELCVGFESGDPDILDAMRKGTKVERMHQFMADARKAGILIHGCFMVGFPGETRETAEKTIRLALDLNPDTVQFYPVMVYPGTEAFAEYRTRGWLLYDDYARWITAEGLHNTVVRTEALSPEDLVRLCDEGRRRFYLRPRYVAYKLGQMLTRPSEVARTLKAARVFLRYLLRGSKV